MPVNRSRCGVTPKIDNIPFTWQTSLKTGLRYRVSCDWFLVIAWKLIIVIEIWRVIQTGVARVVNDGDDRDLCWTHRRSQSSDDRLPVRNQVARSGRPSSGNSIPRYRLSCLIRSRYLKGSNLFSAPLFSKNIKFDGLTVLCLIESQSKVILIKVEASTRRYRPRKDGSIGRACLPRRSNPVSRGWRQP